MSRCRTRILLTALVLTATTWTVVVPVRAGLISRSEEGKLGRDAAREIESKYRTSSDRRVSAIGQRLVRVSDRQNNDFTFKVIEADDVNAISLPGGYVYVFRGLLKAVGNDDAALAGVIAHEIAHVTERHSVKQVERVMGANLLLELFAKNRNRKAGDIIANLLSLKFSREDEYEADEVGIEYMHRAGYDPNGLARFFRMLERSEGGGSRSVIWLRTHPNSGARAKRAEEFAARLRSRSR